MPNKYCVRTLALKQLGYATYEEYLSTYLWESIKQRVWEQKGTQCWLCQRLADVIHHLTYYVEVLKGENLDALVPVCNRCHYKLHFKPDGMPRTDKESRAVYEHGIGIHSSPQAKPANRCANCNNMKKAGTKLCGRCQRQEKRLRSLKQKPSGNKCLH